jgi:hypothetical protein
MACSRRASCSPGHSGGPGGLIDLSHQLDWDDRRANERGEEVGVEFWSDGGPDFPPTSRRPTLGRAGQGGTGGDAE